MPKLAQPRFAWRAFVASMWRKCGGLMLDIFNRNVQPSNLLLGYTFLTMSTAMAVFDLSGSIIAKWFRILSLDAFRCVCKSISMICRPFFVAEYRSMVMFRRDIQEQRATALRAQESFGVCMRGRIAQMDREIELCNAHF